MEFYYDEVDNDVLIITADGGLNAETSEQFILSIEKLVDAGLKKMIVDCDKLDYISSSGLRVLVRLHNRMKRQGSDVKLASLKGALASVLQVTGLNKLFEIYPDVDRARLAFRPKAAEGT